MVLKQKGASPMIAGIPVNMPIWGVFDTENAPKSLISDDGCYLVTVLSGKLDYDILER